LILGIVATLVSAGKLADERRIQALITGMLLLASFFNWRESIEVNLQRSMLRDLFNRITTDDILKRSATDQYLCVTALGRIICLPAPMPAAAVPLRSTH